MAQRRKSHSLCEIWDREAEGPGKKGKAQSQRELSDKARALKREMQRKCLMWALLQKAGRLLQTHPSRWSEQSTLKIPSETDDRMKEDTGGGCLKETHNKRGTVSGKTLFHISGLTKLGESPKNIPATRNVSIHMLFGLPKGCLYLHVYIQPHPLSSSEDPHFLNGSVIIFLYSSRQF